MELRRRSSLKVANKPPKSTRPKASSEPSLASSLGVYLKLGRPKFLMYSMACHYIGFAYAYQQGLTPSWPLFIVFQLTIWLTHMATHYINEYGDEEVDKYNHNAGTWTGGSKVLRDGLVSSRSTIIIGITFLSLAFLAGATTVRLYLHENNVPVSIWHPSWLMYVPWSLVLLGLSVFAIAVAYSLPPLHLAANGLGELCVSYVLTFATPGCGLLVQGGTITLPFIKILAPIFVINAARMIIMNIPDREGDLKGNKITSVVMIGEEKAVILSTLMHACTYLVLLPLLGLPTNVVLGYCASLPLRWWQSLRVNIPEWWHIKELTDSIPFVESLHVLVTVSGVAISLAI